MSFLSMRNMDILRTKQNTLYNSTTQLVVLMYQFHTLSLILLNQKLYLINCFVAKYFDTLNDRKTLYEAQIFQVYQTCRNLFVLKLYWFNGLVTFSTARH